MHELNLQSDSPVRRLLCLGAHCDDIEIGCGGILLRHRAHGDRVGVLTLTGGDKGGGKSARIKEKLTRRA